MRTTQILLFLIFMFIAEAAWAELGSCNIPGSVVPPRWCNYPKDVPNPTAPSWIKTQSVGNYGTHIDERTLRFTFPEHPDDGRLSYVPVLSTHSREARDWLRVRGEYKIRVIGMSWDVYPFGIPLFGTDAQFSIEATVHIKTTPALRNLPGVYDFDRGDFSIPNELFENRRRATNYYVDKSKFDARTHLLHYFSPVEEVIINGRKWYHYLANNSGYPDGLSESYVTGLAPDRYLEINIWQYPVPLAAIGYPYSATGYPTYPTEDQMPRWMKITHKFKEQVIHSLRITHPAGNKQSDLYEVPASSAASH